MKSRGAGRGGQLALCSAAALMAALALPAWAAQIHDAAAAGDLPKIEALLSQAPELLGAKDEKGETPLHLAAQGGRLEVARVFLDRGAAVDAPNGDGQTPLLLAAYVGHTEVAALLLARGAEPSRKDQRGRFPIHFAAREGHPEMVVLLLRAGADPTVVSSDGWTPLSWAVSNGRREVVEVLLKNTDLAALPVEKKSAMLHTLARGGYGPEAQLLLAKGADAKSSNADGGTLLHDAARGGLPDLAGTALDAGVEPNARDFLGRTALCEAAAADGREVARVLVRRGADPNIPWGERRTALHAAEDWADPELVEILKSAGAEDSPRKVYPLDRRAASGRGKAPSEPLEITYIANEGFLLAAGQKAVLVDALVRNSWGYASTPPVVLRKIKDSLPPFDTAGLLLVSHPHADHFDAASAADCLSRRSDLCLVSSPATLGAMKRLAPDLFQRIRAQIVTLDPAWDARSRYKHRGIDVTPLATNHAGRGEAPYKTLVFLVDLGPYRILHIGDTVAEASQAYFNALGLEKGGVDVLLADPFFLRDPVGQKIVRELVRPAQIVVMHMRPWEIEPLMEGVRKEFPGAIAAFDSMEKITFR